MASGVSIFRDPFGSIGVIMAKFSIFRFPFRSIEVLVIIFLPFSIIDMVIRVIFSTQFDIFRLPTIVVVSGLAVLSDPFRIIGMVVRMIFTRSRFIVIFGRPFSIVGVVIDMIVSKELNLLRVPAVVVVSSISVFGDPLSVIDVVIDMIVFGFNVFRSPAKVSIINVFFGFLGHIAVGMSDINVFSRPVVAMSIIFRDPFIGVRDILVPFGIINMIITVKLNVFRGPAIFMISSSTGSLITVLRNPFAIILMIAGCTSRLVFVGEEGGGAVIGVPRLGRSLVAVGGLIVIGEVRVWRNGVFVPCLFRDNSIAVLSRSVFVGKVRIGVVGMPCLVRSRVAVLSCSVFVGEPSVAGAVFGCNVILVGNSFSLSFFVLVNVLFIVQV